MVEMKKKLLLELNLIFSIEKNEFVESTFAINFASRARMSDSLLAHKPGTALRAVISSSYIIIDPCSQLSIKNLFCIIGFVHLCGSINPLLLPGWIRLDVF